MRDSWNFDLPKVDADNPLPSTEPPLVTPGPDMPEVEPPEMGPRARLKKSFSWKSNVLELKKSHA